MSEQFLRVPLRLIRALRAAERIHCGITCVVLCEWERLIDEPDGTPHTAGMSEAEVATLTSLGVVMDGQIMAVEQNRDRLRSYRERASIGGLSSSKRSSDSSSKRSSKRSSKPQATPRAGEKDTKHEENRSLAAAGPHIQDAANVAQTSGSSSNSSSNSSSCAQVEVRGQRIEVRGNKLSSVGSFGADAPTEPPSLALVPENPVAPEPNKFPSWPQAIEALCEAFRAERGAKFVPDGKAMKDLKKLEPLAKGDADEVLRRWRIALRSTHPTVGEWGQLLARWNLFASEGPSGRKTPSGVNLFTGDDPNAERDFFGGGR